MALLAGAAKADITPQPGVDLTGYIARLNPSIGVHDRLYCRALAFSDGQAQLLLLSCDLIGFGIEYARWVKAELERATGIPPANIMLCATHTHSGPATIFLEGCGQLALDYLAGLPSQIVAASRGALAALQPVDLLVAKTKVPGVAVNRREPARGPTDDELTAVLLQGPDGTPQAAALHYSCHAVVLGPDNRLISADFPGAACAHWERKMRSLCFYLQGPCGDINPRSHPGSFADVEETGGRLAEAALECASSQAAMGTIDAHLLRARLQAIRLPLAAPPQLPDLFAFRSEHLAGAGEVEAQFQEARQRVNQAMVGWSERVIAACCSGLLLRDVEVDLQCFEIGDLLILAVPGELFVEYSLEAKRLAAQAGKHALVVAYANGDIGYIPMPHSYSEGGYEVEWAYRYYGYPAPVAREAGLRLREWLVSTITG